MLLTDNLPYPRVYFPTENTYLAGASFWDDSNGWLILEEGGPVVFSWAWGSPLISGHTEAALQGFGWFVSHLPLTRRQHRALKQSIEKVVAFTRNDCANHLEEDYATD